MNGILTAPALEDVITRGQARWLTSVKYELAAKELVAGLTHNPELSSDTQRVVRFSGVHPFADPWHDRDDNSMEALLGASAHATSSGIRYTLQTDQREITFDAAK